MTYTKKINTALYLFDKFEKGIRVLKLIGDIDVYVSEKHLLCTVNRRTRKDIDTFDLSRYIQDEVKKKNGIDLEKEFFIYGR